MLSSQGSSCDSKTFDGAESALRCADFRRGVQGGAHLRWVPARWLAPLRAMSQSLVCFFQCLIGAPPQTNGVHNSSVRASLNDTDGPGVQWHCGSQSESTMFAECKGRRRSHGRARLRSVHVPHQCPPACGVHHGIDHSTGEQPLQNVPVSPMHFSLVPKLGSVARQGTWLSMGQVHYLGQFTCQWNLHSSEALVVPQLL